MARSETIVVEMVDDLDGSPAVETITFAFEGKSFEIDLSKRNASAFRKVITPYVDSARKTKTARQTRRSTSATDPKAIRAWALEHGVDVPARGRIPGAVVEQYQAR